MELEKKLFNFRPEQYVPLNIKYELGGGAWPYLLVVELEIDFVLYGTMVNLKHYSSNDLFLLDQFTPCTNIILGQSMFLLTYVI